MKDTLPPNEPQAEMAVIGCAVIEPALAAELRLEWFYDLRYRTAADALLQLTLERKQIGPDTLAHHLKAAGVEDAALLVATCLDSCHSPANWPYWRDQLTEALTKRRIIKAASEAIGAVEEGSKNASELLEDFERSAFGIRDRLVSGEEECDLKTILRGLVDSYEEAQKNGAPVGISTGYSDLDRLIGGMKPGQLIVCAARPGVGKTSLALNIAERVAVDRGIPVGFYSLEMTSPELVHRLTCSRARVDGSRLNSGQSTNRDLKQLAVAHAQVGKAPLHICDRGGLTLAQLTALSRRMVQRHGIKLMIVDYLGLLRSGEKGRSRYEETTLVSNGLKALAKDLNVPIIALSQLNRDTEKNDRPPRLSDLRDSGAIEQDADMVLLISPDEVGPDQGGSQVGLIVAKNRNGRMGRVDLVFLRSFTRFESAQPTNRLQDDE